MHSLRSNPYQLLGIFEIENKMFNENSSRHCYVFEFFYIFVVFVIQDALKCFELSAPLLI